MKLSKITCVLNVVKILNRSIMFNISFVGLKFEKFVEDCSFPQTANEKQINQTF